MTIIEIEERTKKLISQLLEVWEDSVKATHLFLSNDEIKNIKEYVPQAILAVIFIFAKKVLIGINSNLSRCKVLVAI